MIQGIVFDMDGLMFDTERLAVEGWKQAGRRMGFTIAEEIVLKTMGLNNESTQRVISGCLGENFDFPTARKLRVEYIKDYIETNGIPMKTGLLELLDYLKAKQYKMTVATSSDRETARYYFEKAGVVEFFPKIVCGDMIGRGKPEPDIYLKASEILDVVPEQCLALEDSPIGILSACRAGMKPVMIPDLIQPESEIVNMLYAKLPTLLDVIGLL